MSIEKQRLKERYSKLIKKNLTAKRILIILLVLFVLLIFYKAFRGIILLILFIPMAKYSVRVTAFVNYVTLETYTASTILMAYLFGPLAGLLTGLFLGTYAYLVNSITKFLALLNVVVAATTGVFIGFLVSVFIKDMSFSHAFIWGMLFNNLVAYILFVFMDPDQIQNVTYRTTHIIWNIFIVRLVFILIFNLYSMINL